MPRPAKPIAVDRVNVSAFTANQSPGAPDECWPWRGYVEKSGYGRFKVAGKPRGAHRVAYALAYGDPPSHLVVDHKCRNRSCVNPAHLEAVTNAVNIARGARGSQTHCKHGHEFTEENTYFAERGERVCRTCNRDRQRRYVARKSG